MLLLCEIFPYEGTFYIILFLFVWSSLTPHLQASLFSYLWPN